MRVRCAFQGIQAYHAHRACFVSQVLLSSPGQKEGSYKVGDLVERGGRLRR
jgi:hypothetical protein